MPTEFATKSQMKKKVSGKYMLYSLKEGKIERKRDVCPKCGAGVFMAEHKDRWHCGRCGFTKWKK